MLLTGIQVQRYAGDLAVGVDEAGGQQIQRVVSSDKRVEVDERAVLAEEGPNHAEIPIRRDAHNFARVVSCGFAIAVTISASLTICLQHSSLTADVLE